MMSWELLALAVAPGLAITIFIYWHDRFDREPLHLLAQAFFLGAVSVFGAIFLETWIPGVLPTKQMPEVIGMAVYAFVTVGLSEEYCKYYFLRYWLYPKKEFNEPYDGITYAVMISMGFATIENIFYVANHGMGVAILRMFTAVPLHAVCGVMMGYFMGLAKFKKNNQQLLWLGLLIPVLFHGAYDYFIFIRHYPFMILGALVSLVVGVRLSIKAIALHQGRSPFKLKKR